MKRAFLILACFILSIALFDQITAVLSHNQSLDADAIALSGPAEIIDLGTLGGEMSTAVDLNNEGGVVGVSDLADEDGRRAFQWQNEPMQPLYAAVGADTEAYAINESSAVAGSVLSGTGEEEERLPALWLDGTYAPLPAGDSGQASARDINDQGIAAGHSIEENDNHILLWENNAVKSSIAVVGGAAQVNALNNEMQIVGLIHSASGSSAFLWQEGEFEDLGTLGGNNSIAHDINDDGVIVGEATIEEEAGTHAFLWQDGKMSDLGMLEGNENATSRALGINSAGVIVGEGQVGGAMHAVFWKDGQVIDLNSLLPPGSEWEVLHTAAAINDNGWIAGSGLINGEAHAYLLKPWSPAFFSNFPIVGSDKAGPTVTNTPGPSPTPSATPQATATALPTSTPQPSPTPSTQGYDLARYKQGDGRLYEVHFKADDFETQARHQTQFLNGRFYHTKGNENYAEWEELWNDTYYVYRGTDTSPGNGYFYTLYESVTDYLRGNPGSKWSERYMSVGEMYFRRPYVVFFRKSDCGLVAGGQYPDPSWLKFQAFHRSYTFDTGITLNNVVELAWMPGNENGPTQPVDERYFYAEGYGLVGWKKPSLGWRSAISEEHLPGTRPDNLRETIACLQATADQPQRWSAKLSLGPLPEPYASMVRP